MASSAEPPPKKRRLVEVHVPSPTPSPSSSSAPAPASPRSPVPPPPGVPPPPPQTLAAAASPRPEEAVRKRRNREELRGLFECYRRIRLCVERKDARLLPELEQVYLSLIASSRGAWTLPSHSRFIKIAQLESAEIRIASRCGVFSIPLYARS